MALISCPDCGQNVSTHAEKCPACGYPVSSFPRSEQGENEEILVDNIDKEKLTEESEEHLLRTEAEPVSKKSNDNPNYLIRAIIIFVIFMLFIVFANLAGLSSKTTENSTTATNDQATSPVSSLTSKSSTVDYYALYSYAQDIIKRYLKSPSTVEFQPAYDIITKDYHDGEYGLAGWLDAQNSYGAKIRSYWSIGIETDLVTIDTVALIIDGVEIIKQVRAQ